MLVASGIATRRYTIKIVREPIYQQLHTALKELISSDEFSKGDKFLTEREISERFSVSRATSNKALSNLVSQGVLEFRKGVGTFVKDPVLEYDLQALVSFNTKARRAGKVPRTEVYETELKTASAFEPVVAKILKVKPQEKVYFIKRLRFADDVPVILERRFLIERFCPGLERGKLEGSLYALLKSEYHIDVIGAEEIIKAITISTADASLLRCNEGSAGFLMLETSYLEEMQPLWYAEILYRGDRYELRNRIGSLSGGVSSTDAILEAGEPES